MLVSLPSSYQRLSLLPGEGIFTVNVNSDAFIYIDIKLAVLTCDKICELYKDDPTTREMNINVDLTNDESLNLINLFFNGKEIIVNKDMYCDVFAIGVALGNNELKQPFLKELSNTISEDNVLQNILLKKTIYAPINFEIAFIAKHFDLLVDKKDLLHWCQNVDYEIVEQIFISKSLETEDEDKVIQFMIDLCSESQNYDHILAYPYLEFASESAVAKFCSFISNKDIEPSALKDIWNNASRRLVMSVQTRDDKEVGEFKKKRYKKVIVPENQRKSIQSKPSQNELSSVFQPDPYMRDLNEFLVPTKSRNQTTNFLARKSKVTRQEKQKEISFLEDDELLSYSQPKKKTLLSANENKQKDEKHNEPIQEKQEEHAEEHNFRNEYFRNPPIKEESSSDSDSFITDNQY